jgi:hypothetical protein
MMPNTALMLRLDYVHEAPDHDRRSLMKTRKTPRKIAVIAR